MERKKHITKLILIFSYILLSSSLCYSRTSASSLIYEAYATGNMAEWYLVMSTFEAQYDSNNFEEKLELINYYYGYTGWLVSVDKNDLADKYINRTMKLLDDILKKDPENATVLAYKAAFIAYQIAMSNFKAIYLGKRSAQLIDQALKIDSNNIQALTEKANALYYSPAAFGGDKKISIIYYKRAIKYMEIKKLNNRNWMYLNVLTSLGMAYEATNQIQNAKLCYEKILRVEPDFMWVGDELYPDMLKRHNL